MQWRRPRGKLIAILIVGTLALGEVLRWFFGNLFYNTLWRVIEDYFSFKEADLISYFLGNFIPFVLAAGIVAAIYMLLRYELSQTNSQIPKASEPLKAAPNRGGVSPYPPAPAPLPSDITIKRDHAGPVVPSTAAETKPPAPTSIVRQESPITTVPQATTPYQILAGINLSALYVVDQEKGTVLLRFLPDGGNKPQNVIELILLGNKMILDLEQTPIAAANYAVQKSNVFSGFHGMHAQVAVTMGGNMAEIAAGEGLGSRILKVGLAHGGRLRLSPDIRESVAEMAADLIRRAD